MQAFERRLVDNAKSASSVREALMKNKRRSGQKLLGIQAYAYTAPFSAVAAVAAPNVTPTVYQIQTEGETDFLCCYFSGQVFNNATQAGITTPYSRVQISDNSTNRTMFNIPVFFGLVMGTGGFPYLLQDPRLFPASTIITVSFYNDSTVGPIVQDAYVTLGGYRAIYAV